MKAVIVSAGKGSRLNSKKSKPLTPLLGCSLIERVVLSARKVGIREFVVVTGYERKLLERNLGNGRKFGVDIQYIYNPDWRKGNGISVLKAEEIVRKENFILLMADHVFDHGVMKTLCNKEIEKDECLVCVDRDLEHIDVEEATKVLVRDGKVRDIGKTISMYNGIDCGAFLCSPTIFEAIRETLSQEKDTLTDAVKILGDNGKVRTADVTGAQWIDVDTPKDLHEAEKMLLTSLKKETDGIVARTINRRISIQISKHLCWLKVNPNIISVFCFLLGVVSGTLFIFQNFLLGGVLAQVTSVLDGVDGEVARLTMRESRYGGFLDSILDRYADAFIILGMTYALYKGTGELWIWLVGCIALIGSPMSMIIKEKYHAITGQKYLLMYDKRSRFIPASRDVRLFIVMVGGILNQALLALVVIAVITNVKAFLRLVDMRETISRKMGQNLEKQSQFLLSGT
ncbi:MAG: sugar phosphate nucleotidyltransferase [Candidatus Methanofastidiosia archaeon]